MKIIAGLSKQTSGKILWDDQNIEDFRSDFNLDLQFLGHKNFLKQEFTVYENLNFYAQLYRTENLIEAALTHFKIYNLVDQKVKKLSAGQQKRVILSKLMICPTTIWILDEPTVNLDQEGKKLLKSLIQTKIENHGIALISTHEDRILEKSAQINLEDFKI